MIRRFDAETFARGLADWEWLLGGRDLRPIASSMFGDVFLQGSDGVWFLDSLEGTLDLQWPDVQALQAVLNTTEGQDRYLLGGVAIGAQQRGVIPGASSGADVQRAPCARRNDQLRQCRHDGLRPRFLDLWPAAPTTEGPSARNNDHRLHLH